MTKYKVPDDAPEILEELRGQKICQDKGVWCFVETSRPCLRNDNAYGVISAMLHYGHLIPVEEQWPKEGKVVWVRHADGHLSLRPYGNEKLGELLRGRITRTEAEGLAADRVEVARTTIERYAEETWGRHRFVVGKGNYFLRYDHETGEYDIFPSITMEIPEATYYAEQSHAQEIIARFTAELNTIRKGGRES